MNKCKHKMGLLALRECDKDCSRTCTECNKPVCKNHTKMHRKTNLCIECFTKKGEPDFTLDNDSDLKRGYYRNLYGMGGYMYSEHDYSTFERSNMNTQQNDELDTSDFHDS